MATTGHPLAPPLQGHLEAVTVVPPACPGSTLESPTSQRAWNTSQRKAARGIHTRTWITSTLLIREHQWLPKSLISYLNLNHRISFKKVRLASFYLHITLCFLTLSSWSPSSWAANHSGVHQRSWSGETKKNNIICKQGRCHLSVTKPDTLQTLAVNITNRRGYKEHPCWSPLFTLKTLGQMKFTSYKHSRTLAAMRATVDELNVLHWPTEKDNVKRQNENKPLQIDLSNVQIRYERQSYWLHEHSSTSCQY